MKADPILKELWDIKDGLAAECDHDLRRLFDKLKALQRERGAKLVNRTKQHMSVAEHEDAPYPCIAAAEDGRPRCPVR